VEFGAGTGVFAEGVLETLERRFPPVFAALKYIVVEVSQSSIATAQNRLARFAERTDFRGLDDLPSIEEGVIFSNEMLDALPVNRVTMHEGELCELYVTLDHVAEFAWVVGPLSNPRLSEYFEFVGVQLAEGQTAEVNLAVEDWLSTATSKLRSGYLVTVDYGAEAGELYGDPERVQGTLRGFRRHRLVEDFLASVGEQDITATIDWTFVRKVGEKLGLGTVDFQAQDKFLLHNGLLEELERTVADTADEVLKLQLRTSVREMIMPTSMAASFQVLTQKKVELR
jgi:SAM-dependent MidA family methyltransferase